MSSITEFFLHLDRMLDKSNQDPEAVAFRENFEKQLREQSGENGRCIDISCQGRIVQVIRGASVSGYILSLPRCEKCGREYIFAKDVPTVGHEAFRKAMNQVYRC